VYSNFVDVQDLNGARFLVITRWHSLFKSYSHAATLRNYSLGFLSELVIFDGRNLYGPDKMAEFEINYYAIGRGASINKH